MRASGQQLATIAIFSQLQPTALAQLSQASGMVAYQKNEILIHEGERFPSKLHALFFGSLLLKKIAPSGKETHLRQLPAGEMFAAPALSSHAKSFTEQNRCSSH